MGASEALKEKGYRIPEDISVIGFDDMPTVQFLTPPLTSIRIHADTIARIAIDRLARKIRQPKENEYTVQQYVGVELVERSSVKRIKAE